MVKDIRCDESQIGNQITNPEICLYGLGSTGEYVLACLKKAGLKVGFVIDQKLAGSIRNGTPILSLADAKKHPLHRFECIITLHNHYVNLKEVYENLEQAGFFRVSSIVNIRRLVPDFNLPNGYWLDFAFDLKSEAEKLNAARRLLCDEKSRNIFDQIINFRSSGSFLFYPMPSLTDEYAPNDLPRFKSPLNLIDCGACTGAAIKKLENAGYAFDKIMAFEPDPQNYKKLLRNDTEATLKVFLPLASHSQDTILRYISHKGMASRVDEGGDLQVRASKIDSIQVGFCPNLIKLDVEGAEFVTLVGASGTIENHRPNLCVSVYHRPFDIFEIPLLVEGWGLGYKFYLRVHEHNSFGVVLYCLQDNKILL
jgi:FkbM family methyltransferase